jgi:hypothetical protein
MNSSKKSTMELDEAAQEAKSSILSKAPNRMWQSFLDRMSREHPKDPVEEELSRVQSKLSVSIHTAASAIEAPHQAPRRTARLVDFFCVIGPDMLIDRSEARYDLSKTKGPGDLQLQPRMVDCYPKSRDDLEFPNHIPTFCFPNACRISTEPKEPTVFTLVLTSSSGHRLYGSVLTMYDESIPLSRFRNIFEDSEYDHEFPSWLEDETIDASITKESPRPKKKLRKESSPPPKRYYLPKCLVIISHHAFFHVYTKFLKQLYRIYQSGAAPLPLERYIANMVHDVPLPPLGRARVRWECFTSRTTIDITRPAPNDLPLVNFSYQPLFRCLSVANILVLWGVLLQEGRVALCSKHYALLTPVAEALLSLLFPLQWQGMYIPVLPSGMSDVLEAPVPYLVGLDGSELENVPRPAGVVICDLDQDVVHLGYDDDNHNPRSMPDLPDRDVMRLKVELEEFADPLYFIPPCGIKGRMTTGSGQVLENSAREPYAQMTRLMDESKRSSTHREFILANAERAFVHGCEPLQKDDFLVTGEQEQLVRESSDLTSPPPKQKTVDRVESSDSVLSSIRRQSRSITAHADRVLAFAGQTYATPSPYVAIETDKSLQFRRRRIAGHFYELNDDAYSRDGVSAKAVRLTFLNFFTSLLLKYTEFIKADGSFQHDAFLNSLSLSARNRRCVSEIVRTQMFERFLHESTIRRQLFDEHVIVKRNQSVWGSTKKEPTPFLDETTKWKVQQVITPAAPSTVGIRQSGRVYNYTTFPKLDEDECISSKSANPWTALCHGALCSSFLSFS